MTVSTESTRKIIWKGDALGFNVRVVAYARTHQDNERLYAEEADGEDAMGVERWVAVKEPNIISVALSNAVFWYFERQISAPGEQTQW